MGGFDLRHTAVPYGGQRTRSLPNGKFPLTGQPWVGGNAHVQCGLVRSYRSSPLLLDSFAGAVPASGETLGKKLSGHLAFYQRLNQALVSEKSTQTFAVGKAVYDSVDLGHEFESLQMRGLQTTESTVEYISGKPTWRYERRAAVSGFPAPRFVSDFAKLRPAGISITPTGRTVFPFPEARNMLTSLVPKTGGLGETLVEVIGLNVPSLLSSLRRASTAAYSAYRASSRLADSTRRDLLNGLKPGSKAELRALGFIRREDAVATRILSWYDPKVTPWLRAIGSDYLEVAFGLLPVVEVFLDLVSVFTGLDEQVYGASFRRRRRRTLSQGESVIDRPFAAHAKKDGSLSGLNLEMPAVYRWRETLQITARATTHGRRSALSAQYWESSGSSPLGLIRRLGLLTPSLGWELLPWSWCVDWFANFSSGLKRREFFADAYPIDYAYATYVYEAHCEPTKSLHDTIAGNGRRRVTECTYYTSRLRYVSRKRLDPFGNPWTGVNIDPYKAGILSALGLANLR